MTRAIHQKIVGFSVAAQSPAENTTENKNSSDAVTADVSSKEATPSPEGTLADNDKTSRPAPSPANEIPVSVMGEHIERPVTLTGRTYKIDKSAANDSALYVTINDIVLNEGTEHEQRRPFEIFINSKNMEQFQWIVAITRIMSAVFRKGGDVVFLVEEMRAIFDPKGGYWRPGGDFKNSLVAEIGDVIDRHLRDIGIIQTEPMPDSMKRLIEEKRQEAMAREGGKTPPRSTTEPSGGPEKARKAAPDDDAHGGEDNGAFPKNATLCSKCHVRARVLLDGCSTCLNCGDSKCG